MVTYLYYAVVLRLSALSGGCVVTGIDFSLYLGRVCRRRDMHMRVLCSGFYDLK